MADLNIQLLVGVGKHNEKLKGRQYYSDKVMPKIHGYVVERVRQQLSECMWLSFTCDVGSGPNCSFFAYEFQF